MFPIDSPFDRESCDSWLFSKHVSPYSLNDRLRRRLGVELFRVVLVVHIVANTNELPPVIAAGKKYDCDSKDFGSGDTFEVRSVRFEDELVDPYWDWTNEEGVEFLIMFRTSKFLAVVCKQAKRCRRRSTYEVAEPT